jgi:hypothetical protein
VVSHLLPDWPTSRGRASSSSLSSNASDEKAIFQSEQVQTPSTSHWTWPSGSHRSAFRGGPRGQKGIVAPHIKRRLHPLKVFLFYLAEIIALLSRPLWHIWRQNFATSWCD